MGLYIFLTIYCMAWVGMVIYATQKSLRCPNCRKFTLKKLYVTNVVII